MPAWLHDRARHIQAKNPSMPESEAFAIATQQSHATGHTPKDYGTAAGKREAREKYDTPRDDVQTADPGGAGKKMEKQALASLLSLDSFTDELEKIAALTPVAPSSPAGGLHTKPPRYSKTNDAQPPSPLTGQQPMSAAPAVRT